MSLVSRPSSIASMESLYDPSSRISSAISSAASSACPSANASPENSGDEAEVDVDTRPVPRTPPKWSLGPKVPSNMQPCGVCQTNEGHNWIALKGCGHQFHLSVCKSFSLTSSLFAVHGRVEVCTQPLSHLWRSCLSDVSHTALSWKLLLRGQASVRQGVVSTCPPELGLRRHD